MMVALVEIISKEMIKPSSPTPDHLKGLRFSCLDQITNPVYTPLIFFYQAADVVHENANKSLMLKQSLSEILTVFYPLAGQVEGNSSINCNDNGVEFVEAKVHGQLSDIIEEPNLEELKHFLPKEPFNSLNENIILSLQVNFFDCGGIAVGVSLLHKAGDGKTNSFSFVPISDEKVITKRLILDRKKLTDLKDEIVSAPGSQLKDPTRVEVASAFIWKHYIIDSTKKKIQLQLPNDVVENVFIAQHVVDMRPRMNPPLLPENAFGNCVLFTPLDIMSYDDNDQHEMHHLAYQLRKAIKKIDGDYIKQFQIEGERFFINIFKQLDSILKGRGRLCSFSSWCKFPFYEVDYGWGKPLWVCTTPFPLKDLVIFMTTPSGDGIEAWINMLEDDMKIIGIE
ncbi:hypothetical protein ACJIZ3_019971 [Penstemon smallii]|uniref:Vinorine synthase-like n=1 Tax=Penstemon smallii TaxID=265156 RepID=A0ABD3T2N7_9LAMI